MLDNKYLNVNGKAVAKLQNRGNGWFVRVLWVSLAYAPDIKGWNEGFHQLRTRWVWVVGSWRVTVNKQATFTE
jgi:hypothetical protein